MKTVKDFKDLGVVFVVGDKFVVGDNYNLLEVFVEIIPEGMLFSGQIKTNCGVCNDTALHRRTPSSFAWRPLNTLPDNSKFECEMDIPNHRWRPMLEQAEKPIDDKPVFTQEMADRGELPPVGSEVCFEGENVPIHGYAKSGFPIFEFANGTVDAFNSKSVYTPINNRTPKQKAVDELADSILGSPMDLGNKGLAKYIINLGYEKKR